MRQLLKIKFQKLGFSFLSALAVTSLTSVSSSQEAYAVSIIDNFNSCTNGVVDLVPDGIVGSTSCAFGWGPVGTSNLTGTYDNTTTATAGDVISNATRTIQVVTNGIPAQGSYNINAASNGRLRINNNVDSESNFRITYSGLGGGAGVNLVSLGGGPANARFALNFTAGSEIDNVVTFEITQGVNVSSQSFTLPFTGAQTALFDFSNFTGGSGFFASNQSVPVNQIVFRVDSPVSGDINLDGIGVEPVPFGYSQELGLFAVGSLFGAYKLRQRSKSKKIIEPETQD